MANKKYEIRYLPTFISQFNNILYYITYELKNKIAADDFYNEVVDQILINWYKLIKKVTYGGKDLYEKIQNIILYINNYEYVSWIMAFFCPNYVSMV